MQNITIMSYLLLSARHRLVDIFISVIWSRYCRFFHRTVVFFLEKRFCKSKRNRCMYVHILYFLRTTSRTPEVISLCSTIGRWSEWSNQINDKIVTNIHVFWRLWIVKFHHFIFYFISNCFFFRPTTTQVDIISRYFVSHFYYVIP